jgi:hypothetical protein
VDEHSAESRQIDAENNLGEPKTHRQIGDVFYN